MIQVISAECTCKGCALERENLILRVELERLRSRVAFLESGQTLGAAQEERGKLVIRVLHEVARECSCTVSELLEQDRAASLSRARQLAAYLAHEVTGLSFRQLAPFFRRDRTTVFSNYRTGKEAVLGEEGTRGQAARVRARLAQFRAQKAPASEEQGEVEP